MRWPSIYLSKQQNHSTSHRVVPRDQMNGWQKKKNAHPIGYVIRTIHLHPSLSIYPFRPNRWDFGCAGWLASGFSLPPSRF